MDQEINCRAWVGLDLGRPVQTLYQWVGGSPLLAYPSCIASVLRLESVKSKQIVGLFGLDANKFWTQETKLLSRKEER